MKQLWLRLANRIDNLSLRERALVFAVMVLVALAVIHSLLLDPLLVRQKKLAAEVAQQQNQIEGIGGEISSKLAQAALDPDAAARARIAELSAQIAERHKQLGQMQKGLIAPDKMAGVLEDILKHNRRLRLVSLTTLPVTSLSGEAEAAGASAASATASAPAVSAGSAAGSTASNATGNAAASGVRAKAATPASGVYRHGVELVVEGSYPDMVAYLGALENMPWQLFWGKAVLSAHSYPKATLSLTLYTMSLDTKWMNL